MSDIVKKIKSRGHWIVVIRPAEFVAERIAKLSELENAVRSSTVNLRGWDFPHFDGNSVERDPDHIGQSIDWDRFVETWRAYKSGQFISLSALWGDWRDQSELWAAGPHWRTGMTISVDDAVCKLVEIYEFAARWAGLASFGDAMTVTVTIEGLKGRILESSPGRSPFLRQFAAFADRWTSTEKIYRTSEVLSSARELAAGEAIRLFELFRWDASVELIRDLQRQLRA